MQKGTRETRSSPSVEHLGLTELRILSHFADPTGMEAAVAHNSPSGDAIIAAASSAEDVPPELREMRGSACLPGVASPAAPVGCSTRVTRGISAMAGSVGTTACRPRV